MFDAEKSLRAVRKLSIIRFTITERDRHAANKISELTIIQLVSMKKPPKGGFAIED